MVVMIRTARMEKNVLAGYVNGIIFLVSAFFILKRINFDGGGRLYFWHEKYHGHIDNGIKNFQIRFCTWNGQGGKSCSQTNPCGWSNDISETRLVSVLWSYQYDTTRRICIDCWDHYISHIFIAGLYFAWLGFYTKSLILPTILGILTVVYGIITVDNVDYNPSS